MPKIKENKNSFFATDLKCHRMQTIITLLTKDEQEKLLILLNNVKAGVYTIDLKALDAFLASILERLKENSVEYTQDTIARFEQLSFLLQSVQLLRLLESSNTVFCAEEIEEKLIFFENFFHAKNVLVSRLTFLLERKKEIKSLLEKTDFLINQDEFLTAVRDLLEGSFFEPFVVDHRSFLIDAINNIFREEESLNNNFKRNDQFFHYLEQLIKRINTLKIILSNNQLEKQADILNFINLILCFLYHIQPNKKPIQLPRGFNCFNVIGVFKKISEKYRKFCQLEAVLATYVEKSAHYKIYQFCEEEILMIPKKLEIANKSLHNQKLEIQDFIRVNLSVMQDYLTEVCETIAPVEKSLINDGNEDDPESVLHKASLPPQLRQA
ncbi:MAG: hypothetical protein K0R12_397 [Gammaproteobacteria bacterium]|jgi:hypothetical protein|nr:hypothetical protein [Gammaproteobacteria bacterium]